MTSLFTIIVRHVNPAIKDEHVFKTRPAAVKRFHLIAGIYMRPEHNPVRVLSVELVRSGKRPKTLLRSQI